ncbi:MAG: hypothetical protein JJU11_07965, partial [Candidatus Sumerlaeia bacterium]|nr:hypothetical protein [Candidatus Sumerlaeia bacterium]
MMNRIPPRPLLYFTSLLLAWGMTASSPALADDSSTRFSSNQDDVFVNYEPPPNTARQARRNAPV